jgi:hypothetical protein
MTTVVDPLGSPSMIYNRSGTAIVAMAGGATATSAAGSGIGDDANPIPRVCQTTVAMVLTSFGPTHNALARLPEDAEIGDVVEVYQDPASSASSPKIFPNTGEAIGNNPVSTGTNSNAGVTISPNSAGLVGGVLFRKVSSTQWMPIGAV